MSASYTPAAAFDRSPAPASRAAQVIARCREIAAQTETPGQTTRTFLSPPMHRVHALLQGWMEAAGMHTRIDAAGNLRGVLPAPNQPSPRIVLGSHLDTVPNAGAFDGILGVVLALAAIENLPGPLPVTLELIGFSEEEGVRFRKPFLGSLAAIGALDPQTLALTDAHGTSVSDLIRNFGLDPADLPSAKLAPDSAAYLEVHIEQGPVLETLSQASAMEPSQPFQPHRGRSILGIVDAIVGQSRVLLCFHGRANHAGTTPMHLRHDALAAAAEWILAIEALARDTPGLVATVGQIHAEPGAANVVPGLVRTTLDVRHADDKARTAALAQLLTRAKAAAAARAIRLTTEPILDQAAVPMSPHLVRLLEASVARAGHTPHRMPSGAGHDAMIVAPHLPSVMLFVASPGGLSHHPDESVHARDLEAAIDTVVEFLQSLTRDEMFANA